VTQDFNDCAINRVEYLHLTVRDFLAKPEVWRSMLEYTAGTTFNPHVALLRASILTLKWVKQGRNGYIGKSNILSDALAYGSLAEDSSGKAQVTLLDELDRTVQHLRLSWPWSRDPGCHKDDCIHNSRPLLACAISKGLVLYVEAKVGSTIQALNHDSCMPLLDIAANTGVSVVDNRMMGEIHVFRLPMLDFLLRQGLDPNERRFTHRPPWTFVPDSRWSNCRRLDLSTWQKILFEVDCLSKSSNAVDGYQEKFLQHVGNSSLDACKLFLRYGANPRVTRHNDLQMLDLFRRAFSHLPAERVSELEAIFSECCASMNSSESTRRKRNAGDKGGQSNSPRKRMSANSPERCGLELQTRTSRSHDIWRRPKRPATWNKDVPRDTHISDDDRRSICRRPRHSVRRFQLA